MSLRVAWHMRSRDAHGVVVSAMSSSWASRSRIAGFTDQELMYLVFTVGQYTMIGGVIAAFGIQLEAGGNPIRFDLGMEFGRPLTMRLKPGEADGWADAQYAAVASSDAEQEG